MPVARYSACGFTWHICEQPVPVVCGVVPVARHSAWGIAGHRWEQPVVAVCGVMPVFAKIISARIFGWHMPPPRIEGALVYPAVVLSVGST